MSDDDGEWQFGVEEVGDAAEETGLEAGDIDPENAVFFLLGVAATVVVFVSML